jgi:hypothetical protein
MVHEVITAPLRIGADAARRGLRVVGRAITLGLSATERLIDAAIPRSDGAAGAPHRAEASSSAAAAPPPSGDQPAPTATPSPTSMAPVPPTRPAAAEAPTVAAAPAPTPAHVSRDARHVEAFADPGAEDGAGASVHIEEPWQGYGHMTANDIIARLTTASSEELAAVALYERAHRDRRTVLAAAERELRRATASRRRPG